MEGVNCGFSDTCRTCPWFCNDYLRNCFQCQFLISSQLSFTTYFVPVVKVITVSGVSSTVWIRSQFRTNRVLLIRVTSITLFHLPSLIPPFFLLVEYNSPVTQTIYIKTLLWHDCNKIVKFSTFFVNFCN